jgi:hypothetical protein
MGGAIPPHPNISSRRGAQLKHRKNFTFTLPYKASVFNMGVSWFESRPIASSLD